ncbi:LuxR C-terminal-related transcriptional regulator [Flammeovirga sp. OC4]|uniref:LuxR C-terminal-related transcriptional regulator n=1 Tax=Flammeovirga sp. OC4 TaxID=1382345 RepID=UPI0005C4D430|nr:LuxR C-terminal-related transcriptional regulator [Flammeovirga sp. OC4]
MKYQLLLIFIISSYFNIILAENLTVGIPIVNTFPATTYKAGSQNWSITQNQNGFIYIANNFGLLEFDGVSWKTYTLNKGNNNLKSVYALGNRIYVGGQNEFGYFEKNEKGQLSYQSLRGTIDENVSFDEIWNIYQGKRSNEVIFCSHKRIFVYYDGKVETLIPPKNIRYSFYIKGDFISSSPTVGLLNWNEKRILPQYDGTEILHGHILRSIINFPNGSLLALSHDGKLLINNGEGFKPWMPNIWSTFEKAKINQATLLKDNTIAIATQNNGLFILNESGEIVLHLNKKNGLADMTVYNIFQDQSENLWLAHRNGLSYVELHSPFRLINEKIGIEGGGYAATSFQNELYLGTTNGVYKYSPKLPYNEPHYQRLNIGHTYNLTGIGNRLFQGQHEGLYVINDEKIEPVSSIKGAWNVLQVNKRKDIFLRGSYDGLYIHEKVKDQWITHKIDGFEESSRLLALVNDNTLWISHGFKGVYKLTIDFDNYKVNSVQFYGKDKGFYSNVLINLFQVNNELLFCGENGIFKYNAKKDVFERDQKFTDILGRDRVSCLVNDIHGNIYFIQNNKVGLIYDLNSDSPYVERQLFERINKYISDDLETIICIDPSNVLITAKEGFILFNPRFKRGVQKSIPLSVRNFQNTNGIESNTIHISDEEPIEMPYEFNDVTFSYSTPYFDGLEYNTYQTFLEGFDKIPKPWTTQNASVYTNLKEGNYTFKVTAKNIYGEVSIQKEIPFVVLPPWYRSPFAYLFYIMMTCGFTFGIVKLSKLRYSKKWLSIVGQKEQQIVDQDDTIKQLVQEKHDQEISFKNKELALSTFHLTQRNELLSTIKNDLIKVSSKAENVAVAKEIQHLANRISKDIDDEKDWARFKDHFNLIHSDFFEYFKENYPQLSTQELKICAYIKMNMSTKDIANALNLSVRGVETSRYRLRKKLNLDKNTQLTDFIQKVENEVTSHSALN